MGEFGIRLEAGIDAACNDERVLDWLREHDVRPEDTFAMDLFQDELHAHRYCTNPNGRKHMAKDCEREGDDTMTGQADDAVCKLKPLRIELKRPFPAGVMAGPGHEVGELSERPASEV